MNCHMVLFRAQPRIVNNEGEGELCEAELCLDGSYSIAWECVLRCARAKCHFVAALKEVSFARPTQEAEAAIIVVNFDGSGGNNGTNRFALKRAFQRWSYCRFSLHFHSIN